MTKNAQLFFASVFAFSMTAGGSAIAQSFEQVDGDKNGFISKEEYATMSSRGYDGKIFFFADRDDDDQLSAKEWSMARKTQALADADG